MTSKESFRLGFLTKLAEAGISPTQLDSWIMKRAAGGFFNMGAKDMLSGGKSVLGGLLGLGKGLGKGLLYGIPLTSAAGGYMLASKDQTTEEDVKAMEDVALTKEYENAIHQLHEKNVSKKPRVRKPRPALTAEERDPTNMSTLGLKAAAAIQPLKQIPALPAKQPLVAQQAPAAPGQPETVVQKIQRAKQKVGVPVTVNDQNRK